MGRYLPSLGLLVLCLACGASERGDHGAVTEGAGAGVGGAAAGAGSGSGGASGTTAGGGAGGSSAGRSGAGSGDASMGGQAGSGGSANAAGSGGSSGSAGSSGGTGAGSGGMAGASGIAGACGGELPPWPFACSDDMPVIVDGEDTGFSRCSNGSTHRPHRAECPLLLDEAPAGSCMMGDCEASADCGAHGLCHAASAPGYCNCATVCRTDADCDTGKICQCGTVVGVCVAADCGDDSECDDGQLCLLAGAGSFQCRTLGTVEETTCSAVCTGTCGCDGHAYCNDCQANAQGVMTTGSRDCIPGDGVAGTPCGLDADCRSGFVCCSGPGGARATWACAQGSLCPMTP